MKFGILANPRKKLFWENLPTLTKWLEHKDISLYIGDSIPQVRDLNIPNLEIVSEETLPRLCDMILAFGGDGTILRTTEIVSKHETPILGINVGGLGFLTEISMEEFTSYFDRIRNGEYRIEKRLLLEGTIAGDDRPMHALNEIVIDKGAAVRVIRLETEVDGQNLNTYIADGLLVSTPTGSTGYSLSNGGPIVVPSTNVFIINPICPHSLTNRPVIIPADATVQVTTYTEAHYFNIAADGSDVRESQTRTTITIRKAPFCAHLVKPLDSSFFKILHSKLFWAEDFRNKNRWSYDS